MIYVIGFIIWEHYIHYYQVRDKRQANHGQVT
jgi:hypothetical protein